MARGKSKYQEPIDLPGLFDDIECHSPAAAAADMPVFHGIESHARRMAADRQRRNTDSFTEVEPLAPIEAPDRLQFISFGSGSSGNCSFLGDTDTGILIDAGVDADKVTAELSRNGIRMSSVKGIILTHDHGDHIRYVYTLLRKNRHMALFCTPKAFNGIMRRHNISRRLKDYHHPIYKEIPFKIGAFEITAFEVDHDGTDNAGFFIQHGDFRFAIATDLGCIGTRVDHYMRQAEYIILESNYDRSMLLNGSYPEYLKARIMADNGHMDNEHTAAYIARIYRPEIKYLFLCHLSHDNNTPDIATATIRRALETIGVTVGDGSGSYEAGRAALQLMALPRFDSTGLITLRRD